MRKDIIILSCLALVCAGWTYSFDTSTPAGSDDPREADDRIRETKAALQERLNKAHWFELTGTEVSDTKTGYHRFWFNVEAYGATGDGSTDETAAIQVAIDAAEALSGLEVPIVFFPPGDYYLTSALTVTDPIHFIGSDAKIMMDADTYMFHCAMSDSGSGGLTFENLTFRPKTSGSSQSQVFYFSAKGCKNTCITNCLFASLQDKLVDFGDGIQINFAWDNNTVLYHHASTILDLQTTSFHSANISIINSFFAFDATDPMADDHVVLSMFRHATISNCTFELGGTAIVVKNGYQANIRNNFFEESQVCIELSTRTASPSLYRGTVFNVAISENQFNAVDAGIEINGCIWGAQINNNIFNRATTGGDGIGIKFTSNQQKGLELTDNLFDLRSTTTNPLTAAISGAYTLDGENQLNHKITTIDNMTSLTGWSEVYDGSSIGTLSLATGLDGRQVIQLSSTAGDHYQVGKTFSLDLSGPDFFILSFKINDPASWYQHVTTSTANNYRVLSIYAPDGSNRFDFRMYNWSGAAATMLAHNEWAMIVMDVDDFTEVGSPDWTDVDSIRIGQHCHTGASTTPLVCQFGGLFGVEILTPPTFISSGSSLRQPWLIENYCSENALSLLSVTIVSLAANADTIIYIVPTGKRCILHSALLVAAADAGTSDISIGANGSETDFVGAINLDNLDAQYDSMLLAPVPSATPATLKSYAAGTTIDAKVENQAGSAGNTLYLYGTLY